MIDTNTTLEELLDAAIDSLNDVDRGETFVVRDLFRGFEWVRISRSDRTKLGGMFYRYIKEHGELNVEPAGKTLQHQQKYIKN